MNLPDYSEWLTGEKIEAEELAWAESKLYERYASSIEQMRQVINLPKSGIIEFGCGTGWVPWKLGTDFQYLGIDKNPEMIQRARERNSSRSPDDFFCGDIRQVEAYGIDISCSFAVLKHFGLHEWSDIFRKMLRAGDHGVFTVQISLGKSFDDGVEFHHVWVDFETITKCLQAENHILLKTEEHFMVEGSRGELTLHTKRSK